jgi:hypothetical protein
MLKVTNTEDVAVIDDGCRALDHTKRRLPVMLQEETPRRKGLRRGAYNALGGWTGERAALLNNGRGAMFRLVGLPRYMRAWLNDAKAIVNGENSESADLNRGL